MKRTKGRRLGKIHHYVWNSPAADREVRTNSSDKKAEEDAKNSTLYDSQSKRREWVAQKLLEIFRTYRLQKTGF